MIIWLYYANLQNLRIWQSLPTEPRNGGAVFANANPAVAFTFHAPRVSGRVTTKQRRITATLHPVWRTALPR